MGDFNFHIDNATDRPSVKFISQIKSINCTQHVSGPTHDKVLDLVFTLGLNTESFYSQVFLTTCVVFNLFSDLDPVTGHHIITSHIFNNLSSDIVSAFLMFMILFP